jgi:glutamate/tyrosine decarboxylase-like PLP-dependent enzyme
LSDEHDDQIIQDKSAHSERASTLDITADAMRELSREATALVTDYFASVANLRVFPDTTAEEIAAQFPSTLQAEGEPLAEIMASCRTLTNSIRHNGHPRFFGYVASPATPVGAYADLIASALNPNVTSWRSAPAAAEIEGTVVRWLGSLVGFKDDAQGLLTSGGSIANLDALFIAHRAKSASDASQRGLWNAGAPMTVYASEQVHLSIPKAADILGLGREHVRLIPTDERFHLDMRRLREQVESDVREGFKPFCVVANAGTVNTGAVDPLREVAGIAKEFNLWFHVDGAYGALGSLDAEKRALFDGLELADSVSLDPHKWLYAPVDCGCLLLREGRHARNAWTTGEADYIKVQEASAAESFAFWDYGIELSRRFRALKIWMMLRYYGQRRVAAAIAEDNALAAYMAERINAAEDFELLAPVELSICCFRYVPEALRQRLRNEGASHVHRRDAEDAEGARREDSKQQVQDSDEQQEPRRIDDELDQLNARIMHTVQRGGRAYLSNVTLRGRYGLRACITNFRTTRADIDMTLDIVREAAKEI